jgi:predicted ATP-binding protein involved in virulence
MKIQSLQLSNILSFKFYEVISDAQLIGFDPNLNIIIGENGSGKLTALEAINFLFRKVLCQQHAADKNIYKQCSSITPDQQKQTITAATNSDLMGFRLNANWTTENEIQKIRLVIGLDDPLTTL